MTESKEVYKELNSKEVRARLQCECTHGGRYRPIEGYWDWGYECPKCSWKIYPNNLYASIELFNAAIGVSMCMGEMIDTAGIVLSSEEAGRVCTRAIFEKLNLYSGDTSYEAVKKSKLMEEAVEKGTMLGFDIGYLSEGILKNE